MAPKKRQTARPARRAGPSKPVLPKVIFAHASPKSASGVSLFGAQAQINALTVANFQSEAGLTQRAAALLEDAGFRVLQATPFTINIAGPASVYQKAFKTRIVPEERATIKESGVKTTATYLESPDTELQGLISVRRTAFENVLEGVALEVPRYFFAPSPFAPLKSYWHLRVPGDVSLGCNADRAHRTGITGRGVRVAMVDSGWYKHPYFVARGYRAAPVVLGPGASDPLKDESGHGTGESSNIFAVAPDVELLPVKINFANTIAAFNAAVGLNPDIITCSWGSHIPNGPLSAADQALAAAIAAAVLAGITVIFSAGNSQAGFPGQHPDVIAAGGAFMDSNGALQASNYASGFMSNIYNNRRVPDLCGLVGMRPRAMYIMLPVEPGDSIDTGNAGGTHPNGDETTTRDGWAAFSGTSAAAPQLAGAAALVRQACPRLSPAGIKDVLMKTARDVRTGTCNAVPGIHAGLAAATGPDTATGDGLVDAERAVMVAKVRCLGPIRPPQPITPVQPVVPVSPVTPVAPIEPIRPIQPIVPPVVGPKPPVPPGPPPFAAGEDAGAAPAEATGAPRALLSAEDAEAIERKVLNSEWGLEL